MEKGGSASAGSVGLSLVETQVGHEFVEDGFVDGEFLFQLLAFGRIDVSVAKALSKGCDAVFPLSAEAPHRYVSLPFVHAQESTTGVCAVRNTA